MLEVVGNLWKFYDDGNWAAITTNGTITYDEWERPCCVMGAGVAKQAKGRFPDLPSTLGQLILATGNNVYKLPQYKLYTLPVKFDWWLKADIGLIVRSCEQLAHLVPNGKTVYMVRPGCGAGRLAWRDVKPEIEGLLDDRFVVVELPHLAPWAAC